jgi:hypothetical protein
LYYKIFPYNWYMGCDLQYDPPNVIPGFADWEPAMIPAFPGGQQPWENVKSVYADLVKSSAVGYEVTMSGTFRLQGQNGGAGDFPSNDPTVLITYLNRFCNERKFTRGAWAQIISDHTGADNQYPATFSGQLSFSPGNQITGNGLGPSTLYFPNLGIEPASQAILLAQMPALIAANTAVGFKMPMVLNMQPQSNSATVDGSEYPLVMKELGRGLFIQCRTRYTNGAPNEWLPPMGGDHFFKVMGITGVGYNFQTRFFGGGNMDTTMGIHTGQCRRQMKFDTFKVGSPCWVEIAAGDGDYPEGTFYGTIVSIPDQDFNRLKLDTEPHPEFKAFISPRTAIDNTRLLQNSFMLATTPRSLVDEIGAAFEFEIKDVANAGPVANATNPNSPFQANSGQVAWINTPDKPTMSCIRRPGNNGAKTIYTPNEMFLMFNKDDPKIGRLPYQLQTDENGGFVIHWSDKGIRPANTFKISIALSEELGLDGRFAYDVERFIGQKGTDEFQVLKKTTEPWTTDEEYTTWLPRSALSTSKTEWLPAAVSIPHVSYITGEAPTLYDRDGNEYYYVSSHVSMRDTYENVTEYIYPTVETDQYGELFFEFHDLPSVGKFGNTQHVSVESFSTYSEITIVIPNLPFQSMLGTSSDERILASLRLPFMNGTGNDEQGKVTNTTFGYYGDLIFNTLSSRSYLKVTTDQQLYDCDVEVRLIRRDGQMDVMKLPYKGEFQVKLRLLQTQ